MQFIDFHCDTLSLGFRYSWDDLYEQPEAMLDVRRMKEGGQMAQFFAIFFPPRGYSEPGPPLPDDEEYAAQCLALFRRTLERHADAIAPALNAADLRANQAAGKTSALLTFEDGRIIGGKLENLERWHKAGIRLITLTWNGKNCFGFPNSRDPADMEKGLSAFGLEAIRRMNELGIIIDVSHLSDGGFWDVAAASRRPFVASHSNCRALSPHPRNLTDEMIRALAHAGGVAGLNYCPAFLGPDTEGQESTLDLLSAHVRHLLNVGGEDILALGSDFDGIKGRLDISSPAKVPLLFERLRRDGLSEAALEKLAWRNALRVIEATL